MRHKYHLPKKEVEEGDRRGCWSEALREGHSLPSLAERMERGVTSERTQVVSTHRKRQEKGFSSRASQKECNPASIPIVDQRDLRQISNLQDCKIHTWLF